jgi:hypothetical protein
MRDKSITVDVKDGVDWCLLQGRDHELLNTITNLQVPLTVGSF